MHAAVWRRGRRGIGPIQRSGAEAISFCVFPFRLFLLEELFVIVASVRVPVKGEIRIATCTGSGSCKRGCQEKYSPRGSKTREISPRAARENHAITTVVLSA